MRRSGALTQTSLYLLGSCRRYRNIFMTVLFIGLTFFLSCFLTHLSRLLSQTFSPFFSTSTLFFPPHTFIPILLYICLSVCLYVFLLASLPYYASKSMETTARADTLSIGTNYLRPATKRPGNHHAGNQCELSVQEKQVPQNTQHKQIHAQLHSAHTHTHTHTGANPSDKDEIDYAHIVGKKNDFYTWAVWSPLVKFPWCITFRYSHSRQRSRSALFISSITVWTLYKVTPVIVSLMNHVPSPTSSSSAHINLPLSWNEIFTS